MTVSKIRQIDPLLRLEILKIYMNIFINEFPYKYSFKEFIKRNYPHFIPDTPEYWKEHATHCYYCECELIIGGTRFGHPRRASIDHYQPKHLGPPDKYRYVICCAKCNSNKGGTLPHNLVSRMVNAWLRGWSMWGFSGQKLKSISDKIQTITNDMLFGTGPQIYYIKKNKLK